MEKVPSWMNYHQNIWTVTQAVSQINLGWNFEFDG